MESNIVNGVSYELGNSSKYYNRYNEQVLANKMIDCGCVVNNILKRVLITPSFNDKIHSGSILIGIIYDPFRSGGVYKGVIYNITNKILKEYPLYQLFEQYDYTNSMPFNISDISKVFFF
jgi:hypothetical protein